MSDGSLRFPRQTRRQRFVAGCKHVLSAIGFAFTVALACVLSVPWFRICRVLGAWAIVIAGVVSVAHAWKMTGTSKELSAQLQQHRNANDHAMLVMLSMQDRLQQARECKQWIDALAMLDAVGTIAYMNPDSRSMLETFRREFDLTVRAARAAKEASSEPEANRPSGVLQRDDGDGGVPGQHKRLDHRSGAQQHPGRHQRTQQPAMNLRS